MFHQALVFYTEETAIETAFEMKPYRPGTRSHESNGMHFRFISFDPEQNATDHCSGILHFVYEAAPNAVDAVDETETAWKARVAEYQKATERVSIDLDAGGMYAEAATKGLEFGPMFQNLTNIQCGKSYSPFV
jgi:N-acetyl-anhydromuramyl-L-alanine amidase AmpD